MAAATGVKGEEPAESGYSESKTSSSVTVEEKHTVKPVTECEKLRAEKNDKEDHATKKFVDAPPPATNVWAKRGAGVSSPETSQAQARNPDPKKGMLDASF